MAAVGTAIRSPLAVAHGWIDLLSEGGLPPDEWSSTLDRVRDSLDQLADTWS